MTLIKKGSHWYGDSDDDVREELIRYSGENGYPAEHFASAQCAACGNRTFRGALDDAEGCALRTCSSCQAEHYIGDSAEYASDASLEDCACPCGSEILRVTVGVHLYAGSEDVKWLYLGLLCSACGLAATYGDWKNEYQGYAALLALV